MKTNLTKFVVMGAIAATAAMPAMSVAQRDSAKHRQYSKNTWRNVAIGSGVLGAVGLLKGNSTLTMLGAAGAGYGAYRYEQDRKSQSNLQNRSYQHRGGEPAWQSEDWRRNWRNSHRNSPRQPWESEDWRRNYMNSHRTTREEPWQNEDWRRNWERTHKGARQQPWQNEDWRRNYNNSHRGNNPKDQGRHDNGKHRGWDKNGRNRDRDDRGHGRGN